MKKIKKIIVSVLCVVLCLSMCMNASAACTMSLSKVADITGFQNVSTQGMCVDRATNTVYTAKVGKNSLGQENGTCMIIKTDMSATKKTPKIMVNSNNSQKVTYLYHANDMTFVNVGTKKYIYVATMRDASVKTVKYDIVKLEINGDKYQKVASYTTQYEYEDKNGNKVTKYQPISGLAFVKQKNDGTLVFLAKKGYNIFMLEIPNNNNGGIVKMTKRLQLDAKTAYSSYGTAQNIACTTGNILVTYHQKDTKNNVVINYDYDYKEHSNLKDSEEGKIIKCDKSFSFKVNGSSAYSFYEIESVDIRKNGNPYVIVNANNSKGDADHVLVCRDIYYF